MVVTKPTKAIVSGIGVFITALTAALADDVLNIGEVGGLATALVPLALTVYGVWKVENKPVQEGAHS